MSFRKPEREMKDDVIDQFIEGVLLPLMVRYTMRMLDEGWHPSKAGWRRDEEQQQPKVPAMPSAATTTKAPKLLLSKKEVAAALSISPRSLDTLIATRQLGHTRIARRVMISTRELERFIRSRTISPVRS